MTFTCLRQTYINSLKISFEEYRHAVTGARHIHLASEDDNNVFVVGFLTVPQDSTGVAHILEHTALCGSKRYPVRDPFFMMIRRSLNTFMNAMTGSDWTAYPFASRNVKDFDNLLKVYLDAAFFPNLHELDFAQEGHRLEFSTPTDPTTPLMYRGVVFNEMKGALSSPISLLWQNLYTHLFPTITYHHNSGGDPLEIPNLTHEQLKTFHATHYHPSNAVFMTYGNLPAKRHQAQFEEYVLQHFQPLEIDVQITDEQRYQQPQQVITHYPVSQGTTKDKTHIVVAWLLGYSSQINEVLKLNLLTRLLLSNSASPLYHALETTPLATAPSSLCGFDDNTREATFICGVEGSNPEHAMAIESLILQVLEEVEKKGIPQSQIEAMLHQIELRQREISGGYYPYGLRLLLNTLSPIIYGGDPLAFLDIDSALEELRRHCENRDFIPSLIRQLLLDNPHRLRLVMAPDPQLTDQLADKEKAQLQTIQTALNEHEKQWLIEQATALQARQRQQDDPNLLPKVDLNDIPEELSITEGIVRPVGNKTANWFACGTNGLVYQTIVMDLPDFAPELVDLLPLFCDYLTEVGCSSKSYQQVAAWKTAVSGGVNASMSWRGHIENTQTVRSVFSLSGKALERNQAALTELLWEILNHARFDELSRLRELVAQSRADNDNSITEQGHGLAMTACTSGISPSGVLSHRWYGFDGFQTLKALDDQLDNNGAIEKLADKLKRIRDKLLIMPYQWIVVSEAEQHDSIATQLAKYGTDTLATQTTLFKPYDVEKMVRKAWYTHTDVNFCAKAYPTVPVIHPDAPALMVLGDFLRNGYLHTALREQGGAYGGGAHYDGSTGAFKFFSYRDPRLIDTLADFDNAIEWLQDTTHEHSALEEGILSVISQIDRPSSPAGEAMKSFYNQLHGRTPTQRREFRKKVLQVTLTDLQRVGSTYFQPERANIAVLSNHKTLQDLPALDLERCEL